MCLGVSAVSYLNRVSTKVTPARRNLTPFRAAVGKKHCVCLVALLYVHQCVCARCSPQLLLVKTTLNSFSRKYKTRS